MSKTTLLPDQVFICPRSRCCTFSTTTSDAILHLRDSHSHLLDTPHGIELEKYVTPTELIPATEAIKYSPSDSPIHLCTPCLQLLPSIAAAKDHLHKTPLHARDVAKQVRLNGANSVHRLLRTVKFKLEEPKLSVPAIAPERIVYRQNNYISGRNKEISILNEPGTQRATADGKFIAVTIDNPHECDRLSGWYCVPPTDPEDTVLVYEQMNYLHGNNSFLTIENGPPPGTVFGDLKPSVGDSITQFTYEQNNWIFGNNTTVQIYCGIYENAPAPRGNVKNVQTNWIHGNNAHLSATCGPEMRQLRHDTRGKEDQAALSTRNGVCQNAAVSIKTLDGIEIRGNYA